MNKIECLLANDTMPFSLGFLLGFKKICAIGYFEEPGEKKLIISYDNLFEMPRGTKLSVEERATVSDFCGDGQNIPSIAIQLNRCMNIVGAYFQNLKWYASKNSRRNRRKMTTKDEQRLLRAAFDSKKSSKILYAGLGFSISIGRT